MVPMWCVLSYVCHVRYACHVSYACHVHYALDPSLALVRSLDVTCQACESTGVPLGDVLHVLVHQVSMTSSRLKYSVILHSRGIMGLLEYALKKTV